MFSNYWPGATSGFKFFIFMLIGLTVVGYFIGNPYLVPNIFMSAASQFQVKQPNVQPVETQIGPQLQMVAPGNTSTSAGNGGSSHVSDSSAVHQYPPESTARTMSAPVPDSPTADNSAGDASSSTAGRNRAALPEGWHQWSAEKRARYVRALMARIDT